MADPITALPDPPSRQAPADFSVKADVFLSALPRFVQEANAVATAMNLNATTATSVTELTIGTGSKSLTVEVQKSFLPGMSVKIARTVSPSNWMHGDVTGYNAATGELVVNVLEILGSGTYSDWTITLSAPMRSWEMVSNLKPVVNAAANKLDIYSKTGGSVPDATNLISIAIPDGNGYTFRTRNGSYLSGTSQIIMMDGANYWSKGSLHGEIKTAWLYAIWDGTGIVWALGGYSGFNAVPTTTTAGHDDYFLLESGSTYVRNASHYCVAVARIRYEYDTADNPDHTIQASGENAPLIMWNPKSDYAVAKNYATTLIQGSDIADHSAVSIVVKQSGRYLISANAAAFCNAPGHVYLNARIKTGAAAYGAATDRAFASDGIVAAPSDEHSVSCCVPAHLNNGDTVHLGVRVWAASGNRYLMGDDTHVGDTMLVVQRID